MPSTGCKKGGGKTYVYRSIYTIHIYPQYIYTVCITQRQKKHAYCTECIQYMQVTLVDKNKPIRTNVKMTYQNNRSLPHSPPFNASSSLALVPAVRSNAQRRRPPLGQCLLQRRTRGPMGLCHREAEGHGFRPLQSYHSGACRGGARLGEGKGTLPPGNLEHGALIFALHASCLAPAKYRFIT